MLRFDRIRVGPDEKALFHIMERPARDRFSPKAFGGSMERSLVVEAAVASRLDSASLGS